MKRLATLLLMTFSMNVLALEAQEETLHALEHIGVEAHQTVENASQADEPSVAHVPSQSDENSTPPTPHNDHCAHAANCCFVIYSSPRFIGPIPHKSTPSMTDTTLTSVTLEDPTKPPLA